MKEFSDNVLLDEYARRRSEEAFQELVARHVDFVYSTAMRQLRNPHLAQEATQSAFIALAGKAGQIRPQTVIAGWLHRAVRFAALNLQRSEARRKHWEEEAATMNAPREGEHVFDESTLPQVDGALDELSEGDRDAIILRFLQQKTLRDVAQTLGTSEEAAKKRVSRALEKLRGLLARRGVAISTTALAAGLAQLPVKAAPAMLPAALAALAVKTAVPTMTTAATVIALMASTKAKLGIIAGLIILGGTTTLLLQHRPVTITPARPTVATTPPVTAENPVEGTWFQAKNPRNPCSIVSTPGGLYVTDENGASSLLVLDPAGFVTATDWRGGLRGEVQGDTIRWANGAVWVRTPQDRNDEAYKTANAQSARWQQSQGDETRGRAGRPAAAFGPVTEIEMTAEKDKWMLNLDTGRTHGPVIIGGESMEPREMDLSVAYYGKNDAGFKPTGVVSINNLRTVQVEDSDWDLPPDQAARRLGQAPKMVAGEANAATPRLQMAVPNDGLTRTFLFQTQEGNMGGLQIIGFTEKSIGVKIRYRIAAGMTPTKADDSVARKDFFPGR